MDASERAKRELEALKWLDAATKLGEGERSREPMRAAPGGDDWADTSAGEDARSGNYGDTVSGDEQAELAANLIEWAELLQGEARLQDAYGCLRAIDGLPRGPRDDPEFVERLASVALELGLQREGARYRKRLTELDPKRAKALLAREKKLKAKPKPAAAKSPEVRYRHPKFGEGVLVRRETSGLRVRFADGERVIVQDRLELLG